MIEHSWREKLQMSQQGQMTEKQLAIIIAAIELFGEQGYANTSTREIARQAQVSEGAIFKHYATKKELLLSISRLIIHEVLEPLFDYGLAELFANSYDNLQEFMEKFVENRLLLIEANITLIRVLLQEAMFTEEIRQAFMETMLQSRLPEGIQSLQKQGLLPRQPANQLIELILPGLMGFVLSRYIILPELFANHKEEDRKNFAAFLAHGLNPAIGGKVGMEDEI